MCRFWLARFFLVFAGVLLLGIVSSCGRKQDELPAILTATVPASTAAPLLTGTAPQTTPTAVTSVIEKEIGPVEQTALEFFDLVSLGEIEDALSYWDLPEQDERNFMRLASEWHTQDLQFSIGAVKYSGLVAADDFQDLEEDDPRVTSASLEVSIGEQDYYLMFTKSGGDWKMNGLLVRGGE